MQSFGTRLKYTEQLLHVQYYRNSLGFKLVWFKHCDAMHTSQRVQAYHKNTHGNWQLSLRVEKKPLSSHDHQKLASSGIDATAHPLRVNRLSYIPYIVRNTQYSIYMLSHAIASYIAWAKSRSLESAYI